MYPYTSPRITVTDLPPSQSVLPMLGDYYTNQLLSAAPGTTMIGNAIEGQLNAPGEVGQGAVLSLMLLAVLLIPMIYYVRSTARASRENA